jgi:hypothetical protein
MHRIDPTQAPAEERIGRLISRTLVVAGALALGGVIVAGEWATALATTAIAVVIAIPIVRVGWLMKRWIGQQDTAYAWAAAILLGLVAIGPIIALFQS